MARVRALLTSEGLGVRHVLVCVALAALTLLLPSAPTYDPWAWLIWGREVLHLDLVTTFGPSWKPLPVMFTTVFSLFGDAAAPDLWLVVARAGALLALVLAYRLGTRLGGSRVAGVAAAVALLVSMGWVRNLWLGNSEGLLVALALWAVERHLDDRRGDALLLATLAALLRPEVWPLLGLYGIWLWVREPVLRRRLVLSASAIGLLWLLPELWGSGDLFRAAERANTPNADSPAFAEHPALAVLERAAEMVMEPVLALFAAGLALAAAALARGSRRAEDAAVLVLGTAVLGLVALVAAMTEAGYSGNYRYLVLPAGVACVIAGAGLARLFMLAPGRGRAVAAVALVAATMPWAVPRAGDVVDSRGALEYQSRLYTDIGAAVENAGGRERLLACGDPYTGAFQVPAVAWHLQLHIREVQLEPAAPAVIFSARPTQPEPPAPGLGSVKVADSVGGAGGWNVLTACEAP